MAHSLHSLDFLVELRPTASHPSGLEHEVDAHGPVGIPPHPADLRLRPNGAEIAPVFISPRVFVFIS